MQQAQTRIVADTVRRNGPFAEQGGFRYELQLTELAKEVQIFVSNNGKTAKWSLKIDDYMTRWNTKNYSFRQGKLKDAQRNIQLKEQKLEGEIGVTHFCYLA